MKGLANQKKVRSEDLCLTCGLCCNGVIFGDVKLQLQDKPERLLALGIPLTRGHGKKDPSKPPQLWRFLQPCAALDGCRCRIYSRRPDHCRHFECLLLKEVQMEQVSWVEALKLITRARRKVWKVEKLLGQLGDKNHDLALAKRFRALAKRLETTELDQDQAVTFGKLTLAYHELNLLLQARFYPNI